MSVEPQESKSFREKLKDAYRIVIIDLEDLKEVGNYHLTIGKFYVYAFLVFLAFSVLLVSLIAFSPLRRLMPGYGDIEENREFLILRDEVENLEKDLEAQVIYTQGLQNMLSGATEFEKPENASNVATDISVKSDDKVVITQENLEENKLTRSLSNTYFVPPLIGSISAGFDRKTGHLGIDLLAPKGTAVKSISSGVVINSGFALETGNTITIQHDDDIISVYKHNSALFKKSGDRVSAGEAIAIIGNSGTLSDGPHLHLELWYNGNPLNPANFIAF